MRHLNPCLHYCYLGKVIVTCNRSAYIYYFLLCAPQYGRLHSLCVELGLVVIRSSAGRSLDEKLTGPGRTGPDSFFTFLSEVKMCLGKEMNHIFKMLIEYKCSLMNPGCDFREGRVPLIVKWKGTSKWLQLVHQQS